MAIDRRNFLRLSATAVVAGLASPGCARDAAEADALDRPRLVGMLGPERVRSLGTRYLRTAPSESSASALRTAISERVSSGLHLPWDRTSVDDAVREDFAKGRVVLVDGWILSLTEARQCALFALAPA